MADQETGGAIVQCVGVLKLADLDLLMQSLHVSHSTHHGVTAKALQKLESAIMGERNPLSKLYWPRLLRLCSFFVHFGHDGDSSV